MQCAALPLERSRHRPQPLRVAAEVLVDVAADDEHSDCAGAGRLQRTGRTLDVCTRGPCVVDQKDRLALEVRRRAVLPGIDGSLGDRRPRAHEQPPVTGARWRRELADQAPQGMGRVALSAAGRVRGHQVEAGNPY